MKSDKIITFFVKRKIFNSSNIIIFANVKIVAVEQIWFFNVAYLFIVSYFSLSNLWTVFNPWYSFFEISICFYNSLSHSEYSNLFVVAALSSKTLSFEEDIFAS